MLAQTVECREVETNRLLKEIPSTIVSSGDKPNEFYSDLMSKLCLTYNTYRFGITLPYCDTGQTKYALLLTYNSAFSNDHTKYIMNKTELKRKFDKEFNKFNSYIQIDNEQAKLIVNNIISQLANLNFTKVAVELSPLNSVKFKILLAKEKLLIITKPFVDDDNIIFSYFVNRECIITDTTKLDELVSGFNDYLSSLDS